MHYVFRQINSIIIGSSMQDSINFKIIVLGDQGVGKSSLINRYIKGNFNEQYNVTVGVEYASKIIELDNKTTLRLQIWDTAGQELFRAVVRSFYKGISAVFLLYSIDNAKSFQEVKDWMREVQQHAHEEVVVILIGSRADLQEKREVSKEQAALLLKEINGLFFVQTSSKTGQNIELLFKRAAEMLHKKYLTNGSYRNLVRPVMASGSSRRSTSQIDFLRETRVMQDKKKKCC